MPIIASELQQTADRVTTLPITSGNQGDLNTLEKSGKTTDDKYDSNLLSQQEAQP